MSDAETSRKPDKKLIESVWAEARDLVTRLEGSTVQRLAVQAGEYKIEIERGPVAADVGALAAAGSAEAAYPGGKVAAAPGPGPGVDPGARGASGVHGVIGVDAQDGRVPVLAPLVGTFYRSSQPGSKPFVEEGDVVEAGQTVCIVEAMKLMNEVAAGEAGKVAEIVVENGQWVEFEQVLMYLEPNTE